MKKTMLITVLLITIMSLYSKPLLFVCLEYPPYLYKENGVIKGLDILVILAVCKDAGLLYRIEFYPWLRCIGMMTNKTADGIFGILKNPVRLLKYYYTDKYISKDNRIIASLKLVLMDVKTINNLKGSTVGVVSGYFYSKLFDLSVLFSKDLSPNSLTLVRKLKYRRSPFIAINLYVMKYYDKQNDLKVHPYIINDGLLFLAFNKTTNCKALFDKFNKSLNKLHSNGTIKKILNKYK